MSERLPKGWSINSEYAGYFKKNIQFKGEINDFDIVSQLSCLISDYCPNMEYDDVKRVFSLYSKDKEDMKNINNILADIGLEKSL